MAPVLVIMYWRNSVRELGDLHAYQGPMHAE
jgi:hypothetical protein